MKTRDTVVVGSSAGGVEALPKVLAALPPDFPASVTIVQHMQATSTPYLVDILRRATPLPVHWIEQGMRVERGNVYVAPPDTHALFTDSHFRLSKAPRENHARPSICKLFRSAAAEHGASVIGVLLTGMLDDGVGGLCAIRDAGGLVIVQDPDDADFPELPSRALLALQPDRVLPITGIASALLALAGQRVEPRAPPDSILLESKIDRETGASVSPAVLARAGNQTEIPCPGCGGPTWMFGDERSRRFRCYHGHVNTAREIVEHASTEVEAALWSAVRALSDRAATLETLAADNERIGRAQTSTSYARLAAETRVQAELVRKFVADVVRIAE